MESYALSSEKHTRYTEFLFSLHERYRKTFCFKKIEGDMIKILIHVVIGLGCYFIYLILQQNNRRAPQRHGCFVFIIFKQLDRSDNKSTFYEQSKEYAKIILTVSDADSHLFLGFLCSHFDS